MAKYVPGLQRSQGRYIGSGVEYDDYSEDFIPYNPHIARRGGCSLPHDGFMKDEDKLASLSGPVDVYYIQGGEKSAR